MNFSGGLFCWKKQSQKIRLEHSGPKFGRPKFVSLNSALNSGSGGAKSPVQIFVSDFLTFEIIFRLLRLVHKTSLERFFGLPF